MRTHKGIPILNFYYMLAYAFELVGKNDLVDVGAEEFANQQSLLAKLLEAGISRQLKQGLSRDYVQKKDDLQVLRGKIDMRGSMRNLIAQKRELCCEYDELTEDIILNQILKTTALLLIKSPDVPTTTKDGLKKEMLYFSDVSTVEPRAIRWDALRFNRNNNAYRFLMSLCQLVIEGMLMVDSAGEEYLAPDIDEDSMNRVFERFILRYYQKHHPSLSASAPSVPWAVDDGYTTMLPSMNTDITINSVTNTLIIDAKYYGDNVQHNWGSSKLISENLYQIFTYVKNMAANDPERSISGMLLYARTSSEYQPDEKYLMSGDTIYVRTLDLGNDFNSIASQLDDIAALVSEVKQV